MSDNVHRPTLTPFWLVVLGVPVWMTSERDLLPCSKGCGARTINYVCAYCVRSIDIEDRAAREGSHGTRG